MLPKCSIADDVRSYPLPGEGNPFAALLASVRFEDVGRGRQGAVLVRADAADPVPLVRTTARYTVASQRFRPIHETLARTIQQVASVPQGFNNALIENYTNAYTTMGGHSDQALDLAEGSHIAVFSCYERPEFGPPRKLLVESKATGETAAVELTHNTAVVFSVAANRRLRHRIVLESAGRTGENRWLGLTFRTSKTFVRYRDGGTFFADGTRLILADEGGRRDFYGLRGRENAETEFAYPRITYTISEGDLLPPL